MLLIEGIIEFLKVEWEEELSAIGFLSWKQLPVSAREASAVSARSLLRLLFLYRPTGSLTVKLEVCDSCFLLLSSAQRVDYLAV